MVCRTKFLLQFNIYILTMFGVLAFLILIISLHDIQPLKTRSQPHFSISRLSQTTSLNLVSSYSNLDLIQTKNINVNHRNILMSTTQLMSQSDFEAFASDWGLFEKVYKGPEWLGFFDVANLPFPSNLHDYLIGLPVWTRLLIGFSSLEIIPLAVDAFILYSLWKRVTTAPESFDSTDIPYTYDKEKVLQYFMKYPILVIKRTVFILEQSRELLGEWLQDRANGALESNAMARAQQLTDVLRLLGPTTVEIGRALARRVDLLPPPYIEALSRLEILPDSDVKSDSESMKEVVFQTSTSTSPSVRLSTDRNEARVTALLDIFILRTLFEFAAQNIPSLRERLQALVSVIDACCERVVGGNE